MFASFPDETTQEARQACILAEVDRQGKYLTFTLAGSRSCWTSTRRFKPMTWMPWPGRPDNWKFINGLKIKET